MSGRAIFLDRDGVLTRLVWYESHGEWESPRTLADLEIIDGVPEALERLRSDGWLLFIITNQPSYAKGKVSRESLEEVHAEVLRALPVTKSYVCFHHPEGIVPELSVACDCRKPGTRFLREAAAEFDVDLSQSWMIGDQDADLLCGRAAGCRVALVETSEARDKRGSIEPDLRVNALADFVPFVVKESTTEAQRTQR
jgi:histidinol-phosphate phosphatase family protein